MKINYYDFRSNSFKPVNTGLDSKECIINDVFAVL